MVRIASAGTWRSPISAADVAAAGQAPGWVARHTSGVWWTAARPDEGGRQALMRHDGTTTRQVLAAPWNARTRVHEYGGRPFAVLDTPTGTRVVFAHWDDQRLYLLDPDTGDDPVALTPDPDRPHGLRYADLVPAPDATAVWCVRETLTGDTPQDVTRDLVAVPLDGSAPRVLTAGHRFLTAPTPSPDGRHAAWIGWDHPDMPWDSTRLCVAELTPDGTFGPPRVLAGGDRESVCQLAWESPDSLLALTDPHGWWTLHRIGLDGHAHPLTDARVEIGGPLWQLGQRWFAPLGAGRFAVLRGGSRLAVLDERSGTVTDIDTDRPLWSTDLEATDGVLTGTAAAPTLDPAVVTLDLSTGTLTTLSPPTPGLPDPAYLPEPHRREFPGPDGRTIPAWVYPPTNPDHALPPGQTPPYLVHVHGGPTSAHRPGLSLEIAYFTSRGLGVVAVDHGGSTGNGRAYREALRGRWGQVDVDDCAAVAAALAAEGTADPDRLAVRGGSAGGWTAAASLTSTDVYRCAVAYYPVIDTARLLTGDGTHDFESHYLQRLVDPHHDRSPMARVDHTAGPVLLLQGLEDKVCPPEQAHRFATALQERGVPHTYLTFPGEQHGFRRAETLIAAHEAELSFYGQVFGFTPPGVPTLELRR